MTETDDCLHALDELQLELDGVARGRSPRLTAHLELCQVCRERFAAAQDLLAAFPPLASADLSQRVTCAVRADARRRMWARASGVGAALAACLLAALWLTMPLPADDDPRTLEDRFADARDSVLEFANDAKSKVTWPELNVRMVEPNDVAAGLEPATASLAHAGKGLAEGFSPVTDSAKRAVSLFRRTSRIAEK